MVTRCADLTVDQLLDDPMIRTLMRADDVDPRALGAMLRGVADNLKRNAPRAMLSPSRVYTVARAGTAAELPRAC